MEVPLQKFEFNYKIDNNKLNIDYLSEKATDVTYEFWIDDDVLTLKGVNGTFVFKKVVENEKKTSK